MLVCHACDRHYRFEDARCPFCSTPHRTVSAGIGAAAALASGLMLFACTGEEEGESSDTTSDTGDTTGETGDTGDTTDTDSGDSTTSTTETGGEEYGGAPPAEPTDWR